MPPSGPPAAKKKKQQSSDEEEVSFLHDVNQLFERFAFQGFSFFQFLSLCRVGEMILRTKRPRRKPLPPRRSQHHLMKTMSLLPRRAARRWIFARP
jgi:hypothetical protein